ncbi:S8 family serine peptidase [Pendulispora albinea]|uniref:S8 family serine peptidase n=1 Tax=Pendulispora albinea TaxID=2741071 RepID=A0ABZ2M8C2_9BACT
MKRLGLGVTVVSIVVGFSGCSSSSDPSSDEARADLGDGVSSAMLEGRAPTSVLVYLKGGAADLSPAARAASNEERGVFVHTRLREHAKASQKSLLAWLDRQGANVQPFFIVNAVLVNDASPGLIRKLAARDDVERIIVDKSIPLQRVPSDPAAEEEAIAAVGSNITATGAPRVWNELKVNGAGVVVAGQDTGVDWTHPALKSHYRGWNGTTADHRYSWHDAIRSGASGNRCGFNLSAPCDDNDHGTHTVGTIVGDDGAGNQIGMAPGAKWIACRNMDAGNGKPSTYIECSQWFLAPYPQGADPSTGDPSKRPDVINNSWGCPSSEGCTGRDLVPVVQALTAAGVLFVASAGNSGSGCNSISDQPATISPETLSVGAYSHTNNTIAAFSSRGPSTLDKKVGPDVAAPGVSIRSSVPGGGYSSFFSGTSMAGPHVVGEVALLISANPSLRGNIAELTRIVTTTATPKTTSQTCGGVSGSTIPNNTWGYGIINAYKAVSSKL